MPLLTGRVECEACGLTYEGEWADDSDTPGDMDAAPVQVQACPGCGSEQEAEWPGWAYRSEAG